MAAQVWPDSRSESEPLLEVVDLSAEYRTARGRIPAVDGVSFDLAAGEALAVVGESGSGKTALALSLLRLLPDPPGRITGGHVFYRGEDLLELGPDEMTDVRGGEIAMVFQEPGTALNPVLTVEAQVAEAVVAHEAPSGHWRKAAVRRRVVEALAQAGVPSPERRLGQYPHELSGGLKQRVVIAMALAARPAVLVADEPTTALDVTVQARLLDLLGYLQARLGLSLLLITHDLGVVARTADRVAVMYAGRLVEAAPVGEFFRRPVHPYSRGLLEAARMTEGTGGEFKVIEGSVPDLTDLPPGCRFWPRCRLGRGRGSEACRSEQPPLRPAGGSGGHRHVVACFVAGGPR